jgi:arsenate reductase
MEANAALATPVPIFLKIAPDLDVRWAGRDRRGRGRLRHRLHHRHEHHAVARRPRLAPPRRNRRAVGPAALRAQHAGPGAALPPDRGRDPAVWAWAGCRPSTRPGRNCARALRRCSSIRAGLCRDHAGRAHRRGAGPQAGGRGHDHGRCDGIGGGRMALTLWHNPRCSKSRAALALLEDRGVEPEVRLYLKAPPSARRGAGAGRAPGPPLREILRRKEAPYRELGLAVADDAALARRWPRTRSCWNAPSSTPARAR